MQTLIKKTMVRLFALLFVLSLPVQAAQAQVEFGLQGGYSFDAFHQDGVEEGAYMLGAQARFGLEGLPIIINPSFDYYFNDIEVVNTFQFNINGLIQMGHRRSEFRPYFGLGLGVTRVAVDGGSLFATPRFAANDTDYGMNLVGGATLGRGPMRLFLQVRHTLGHHLTFVDEAREKSGGLALMGGLLFRVSRY